MSNILNITNGDCAVELMKLADIPGHCLPWRDVLHEGPVPGDITLEALSRVRAEFINDRGWASLKKAEEDFFQRDNTLKACEQFDKVILWFEHDLYDQLQLIQILDWFHHAKVNVPLSIICTDQYLGCLTPEQMAEMPTHEISVTGAQLSLASSAWSAFRSDTPEQWAELLSSDTSGLLFLEGAVLRMLEELPSPKNGLSRTEEQALKLVEGGEQRAGRVFGGNQALEERVFLGDASFWAVLDQLIGNECPLLQLPEGIELMLPPSIDQAKEPLLSLTDTGRKVLMGDVHWLDFAALDRWVGGVHLTSDNVWYWDRAVKVLSR